VTSQRLRLATWGARHTVRRHLMLTHSPTEIAKGFERCAKWMFRTPPYLCHLTEKVAGLTFHWINVGPVQSCKIILYFHGGAYMSGSGETHTGMLARLSKLSGTRICAVDYRLLQEAPFPAAFEDALQAWFYLISLGYDPADIVIGGDSAGGGLMLALLAHLSQIGVRPAAAFGISPWTDLTLSGASLTSPKEALLPASRLGEAVDLYLGAAPRTDPRASPLFATFISPPPVLIQISAGEALADDGRRMAARLQDAGAAVTLQEWGTAMHVFHIFDGWVPEARNALKDISTFVQTSFDIAKR